MAFTEVTSTSWFSRIGKSIVGALIGLVMFVIAFPLLFWNEGRAVQTARSLDEGLGAIVSVASDRVDPANENKLVHVTGQATTSETLSDQKFGVSAVAIKLFRKVEMYQWDETKRTKTRKKLGGGEEKVTTYDYNQKWSSQLIDSSDFRESGHTNPARMPYPSQEWVASDVTLGAFHLSPPVLDELDDSEPLDVKLEKAPVPNAQVEGSAIYVGDNSDSPRVGDVRIEFAAVKPGPISVAALQVGETFAPYQTHAGDSILLVETGTMAAAQMFAAAQDRNSMLTWILRGAGWLVMFIGLGLAVNPLKVLADVVPFIGTIVGAGTGLVAFLLASCFSLVTVAVAWVAYRPLLGIALLLVGGGAAALLVTRARSKKKARIPPPPMRSAA